MAVLTDKTRNKLMPADFGLPKSRSYPMPDRAHAANAKARASQEYNAGRLTAAQKAEIDRKADAVLK